MQIITPNGDKPAILAHNVKTNLIRDKIMVYACRRALQRLNKILKCHIEEYIPQNVMDKEVAPCSPSSRLVVLLMGLRALHMNQRCL